MLDIFTSIKFERPPRAYAQDEEAVNCLADESESESLNFEFPKNSLDLETCKNGNQGKYVPRQKLSSKKSKKNKIDQSGLTEYDVPKRFDSCDYISSDSESSEGMIEEQFARLEAREKHRQAPELKPMDRIVKLLNEEGLLEDFYGLFDRNGEISHSQIIEFLCPRGKVKNFKYLLIQRLLEAEILHQ